LSDFFDKSIDDLLHTDTKEKEPEVDITYQVYLDEIAAMRDFTPPEDSIRWPKPIGPLWKN